MTAVQAFILGTVAGFFLLSMVIEVHKRGGLTALDHAFPYVGATFVYVVCRGCMASDHQIKWIGVGHKFEPHRFERERGGTGAFKQMIVVRVVKFNGEGVDVRDESFDRDHFGYEKFFVDDLSIQRIGPMLYMIFK